MEKRLLWSAQRGGNNTPAISADCWDMRLPSKRLCEFIVDDDVSISTSTDKLAVFGVKEKGRDDAVVHLRAAGKHPEGWRLHNRTDSTRSATSQLLKASVNAIWQSQCQKGSLRCQNCDRIPCDDQCPVSNQHPNACGLLTRGKHM